MNKFKSNKGITLLTLTIYVITLLIVLGLLSTIRTFFYKNIDIIERSSKYASSFDKFNSNFVSDVKNNQHAKIENTDSTTTITFENGTTYIYNAKDKGIYKGKIKIASEVTAFTANKKNVVIKNIQKEIISINIVIGNSSDNFFNKNIDYTLKYW